MNIHKIRITATFLLLFFPYQLLAQYSSSNLRVGNIINGDDYITGEDGIPRITVNVWGHVKYPGTYLIYDGVDILTLLSVAGGPLKGAKLNNIRVISQSGASRVVDLDDLIDNNNVSNVTIKPHDTIHVDETLSNYMLTRANVVNVLLQITNLILITTGNR